MGDDADSYERLSGLRLYRRAWRACDCGDLSKVDERRRAKLRKGLGDDVEERAPLDIAMGAEAGCDAVEVGIVVTGVADELPCAFGKVVEELAKDEGVEVTGGGDAEGTVGGEHRAVAEVGAGSEAVLKLVEERDLHAAEAAAMTEGEGPGLLERVSDRADGALTCHVKQCPADGREEVCVLVGIQMCDGDAGGLELQHLRQDFCAEVALGQLASQSGCCEGMEGWAEAPAVGADERGNGLRRRDRDAIGEDDVAADAERGVALGDGDGIVKGRAIRHQGCGAEGAGAMQLFDRAIDTCGEAEVVRVDDQASGHGL